VRKLEVGRQYYLTELVKSGLKKNKRLSDGSYSFYKRKEGEIEYTYVALLLSENRQLYELQARYIGDRDLDIRNTRTRLIPDGLG